MMASAKIRWLLFIALLLSTGWLLSPAQAQEQTTPPQLFITGSDASSPPGVELRLYGMDSQGRPLALTPGAVTIRHNGEPVDSVEVAGTVEVGTLTVFLIDIPEGVANQLPAIEATINQYASDPTMREPLDYIAIYRVGPTGDEALLAPTNFHNSVRNFFATPLAPTTGATALIDSIVILLTQIEGLKPSPDMPAAIVVISDGTDAVSTQAQPQEVPGRAASLGIPVHTIWLENENLSGPSQLLGQNYLAEVAAGSRGLTANLGDSGAVAAIWERIASFRNQTRLRYTAPAGASGTATVEVSLTDQPAVQAETTISVAANAPSVVINLPPESRSLTLPDLNDPVRLRLNTTVSWLDGVEREVTAAQLMVNGVIQDIPVNNLSNFTAEVNNLQFGENNVQVVVLDEQGLRASSPPLVLTVAEGPRQIPPELAAGAGFGQTLLRLFIFLFVLALLAGLAFLAWQQGWLARLPALAVGGRAPRVRIEEAPPDPAYDYEVERGAAPADGRPRPIAYLEVLESTSRMPGTIPLAASEIRIGRSPGQADVVFENDITVSRLHASLMLEGRHYRLFDANSTSGTWVNEKQVPEYGTQLMDGDEIHLGAVHLRYRQP